jgi:hypothetical protein
MMNQTTTTSQPERDATGTIYRFPNGGFAFAELDTVVWNSTKWIAGTWKSYGGSLGYDEYMYVGGKRNPTKFDTREEAEAVAAALSLS